MNLPQAIPMNRTVLRSNGPIARASIASKNCLSQRQTESRRFDGDSNRRVSTQSRRTIALLGPVASQDSPEVSQCALGPLKVGVEL